MNESMISYWENQLKDHKVELKVNDYIVHVAIVDKRCNKGVNKWISCDSLDKLQSLLGCVVLPSCQITKALMERNDGQLFFDAIGYDETENLLLSMSYNLNLLQEYQECYRMIESYENDFEGLTYMEDEITKSIDYTSNLSVKIKIYENIKSAGLGLINDYEKKHMIKELEETFKFSVDNIREMFVNLDNNNNILLKRVIPMLDELNIL